MHNKKICLVPVILSSIAYVIFIVLYPQHVNKGNNELLYL